MNIVNGNGESEHPNEPWILALQLTVPVEGVPDQSGLVGWWHQWWKRCLMSVHHRVQSTTETQSWKRKTKKETHCTLGREQNTCQLTHSPLFRNIVLAGSCITEKNHQAAKGKDGDKPIEGWLTDPWLHLSHHCDLDWAQERQAHQKRWCKVLLSAPVRTLFKWRKCMSEKNYQQEEMSLLEMCIPCSTSACGHKNMPQLQSWPLPTWNNWYTKRTKTGQWADLARKSINCWYVVNLSNLHTLPDILLTLANVHIEQFWAFDTGKHITNRGGGGHWNKEKNRWKRTKGREEGTLQWQLQEGEVGRGKGGGVTLTVCWAVLFFLFP